MSLVQIYFLSNGTTRPILLNVWETISKFRSRILEVRWDKLKPSFSASALTADKSLEIPILLKGLADFLRSSKWILHKSWFLQFSSILKLLLLMEIIAKP